MGKKFIIFGCIIALIVICLFFIFLKVNERGEIYQYIPKEQLYQLAKLDYYDNFEKLNEIGFKTQDMTVGIKVGDAMYEEGDTRIYIRLQTQDFTKKLSDPVHNYGGLYAYCQPYKKNELDSMYTMNIELLKDDIYIWLTQESVDGKSNLIPDIFGKVITAIGE